MQGLALARTVWSDAAVIVFTAPTATQVSFVAVTKRVK
jgi:hypothetical protein